MICELSYMYVSLQMKVLQCMLPIEEPTCTCLEYRVSWVRVPPEAVIFSRKSDCLGCAVLLCLVCLFDLACFFLSSFSSLI